MLTLNIILVVFAAAQVMCAKTLQESTEDLKNLWANLKAYPTVYTQTGKLTVEDTFDTVDYTKLKESTRKIEDDFYWGYRGILEQTSTIGYYKTACSRNVTICPTFFRMAEHVHCLLDDVYDAWMWTPAHKELTSRWTKAHDLIVLNS